MADDFNTEFLSILEVSVKAARAVAQLSEAPDGKRNPNIAVPYFGSQPDYLPRRDNTFSVHIARSTTVDSFRGEMQMLAIGALFHDARLHARLRPAGHSAGLVFDSLERIRV